MGDSWISGQADVDNWGPFLYGASEIDVNGLASIKTGSDACDAAIAAGDWAAATNAWGHTEGLVSAAANGVDWYNMLCPSDLPFCQGALQRARDPLAAPPAPLSAADLALAAPGIDHGALNRLYGRHLFPFTHGAQGRRTTGGSGGLAVPCESCSLPLTAATTAADVAADVAAAAGRPRRPPGAHEQPGPRVPQLGAPGEARGW